MFIVTKIAIVDGSKFEIGGVQEHLLELVSCLDPKQYHVLYIRRKANYATAKLASLDNVVVEIVPFNRVLNPFAVFAVVKLLNRHRANVVHSHTPAGGILGRIAALALRDVATVHTVHGLALQDILTNREYLENKPLYRLKTKLKLLLERALDRRTDELIALSAADASRLISGKHTNASRIAVIPNGISDRRRSDQRNAEDIRAALEIPAATRIVLSIGNLTSQKGHAFLIDAMASMQASSVACTLLLVGEGPDRDALERRATSLGLLECVRFLGRRNDVGALLKVADIFVLSSLWEGLPISLLEAMFANSPIVATSVGGIPEVIRHGQDGLLVEPADSQALSHAIRRLLLDSDLAHRLAASASNRARTLYSSSRMASETQDVYQKAVRIAK
jgi:glycosyltransferase involved in cell wall biosynthesis